MTKRVLGFLLLFVQTLVCQGLDSIGSSDGALTPTAIEEAIARGEIIPVTGGEIAAAFLNKALIEPPFTLRLQRNGASGETVFDLTVLRMTPTASGVKFTIGSRLIIPESSQVLYFGKSDIEIPWKGGALNASLPLLNAGLSADFGLGPDFRFILNENTALRLECGLFSGLTLNGNLTFSRNVLVPKDGQGKDLEGEYRSSFSTTANDLWNSDIWKQIRDAEKEEYQINHPVPPPGEPPPANPPTQPCAPPIPLPTLTADRTALLQGEWIHLTAGSCEGNLTWEDGSRGAARDVRPANSQTYRVRCERAGCFSDWAEIRIEVQPGGTPACKLSIQPTVSADRNLLLRGESTVLRAGLCEGILVWEDGFGGAEREVRPENTTTYGVRCEQNGCFSDWSRTTIEVQERPQPPCTPPAPPVLTAERSHIVTGETIRLIAGQCAGTWVWEDGFVGREREVRPETTATFSVRCEQNGCASDWSRVSIEVTAPPQPPCTPPAAPRIHADRTEIQAGEWVHLGVDGCVGTPVWEDGQMENGRDVSPRESVTYRVKCRQEDCASDWAEIRIEVRRVEKPPCSPPAAPTLSADRNPLARGESTMLKASQCEGMAVWEDGFVGPEREVRPETTAGFGVRCERNGCAGEWTRITIEVQQPPPPPPLPPCTPPAPPVLTADRSSISLGENSLLRVETCEGSLVWEDGTSVLSREVSPQITSVFRARCEGDGCNSDWAEITVTVTALPPPPCSPPAPPAVWADRSSILRGETVSLHADACEGTVVWADGYFGSNRAVSPPETTLYNARCERNGCAGDWSRVSIEVTAPPQPPCTPPSPPTVWADRSSIQRGESTRLNADQCPGTVLWEDGIVGGSREVNPQETTTYRVGCERDGCRSDWSSVKVEVQQSSSPCIPPPGPFVSPDRNPIGRGESTILRTGPCEGVLVWEDGFAGTDREVSPQETTIFRARCERNGCASDWTVVTIEIIPPCSTIAVPTVSADRTIITKGESVHLSAGNWDGMLVWEDGAQEPTRLVGPTVTTTYRVRNRRGACWSEWGEITIIVNETPPPCTPPPAPEMWSDKNRVNAGDIVYLVVGKCEGEIEWEDGYAGAERNEPVYTSKSFRTRCRANGCFSDWAEVNVEVMPPAEYILTGVAYGPSFSNSANCDPYICNPLNLYTEEGEFRYGSIVYTSSRGNSNAPRSFFTLTSGRWLHVNGEGRIDQMGDCGRTMECPQPPVIEGGNEVFLRLGQSQVFKATCSSGELIWDDGSRLRERQIVGSTTTTYTVRCERPCCPEAVTTLTVHGAKKPEICFVPPPVISSNKTHVCEGDFALLEASGCEGRLVWYSDVSISPVGEGATISVNHSGNYSARCEVGENCTSDPSNGISILVTGVPAVSIAQIQISRNRFVLTANSTQSIDQYEWTTGETGPSIEVSNQNGLTYGVRGISMGCAGNRANTTLPADITIVPVENIRLSYPVTMQEEVCQWWISSSAYSLYSDRDYLSISAPAYKNAMAEPLERGYYKIDGRNQWIFIDNGQVVQIGYCSSGPPPLEPAPPFNLPSYPQNLVETPIESDPIFLQPNYYDPTLTSPWVDINPAYQWSGAKPWEEI
ncbi:hypothetical protein [Larkinella soli]|uniref:hypothetical protein n=1 Tax=Larkinella soli TaxID=1770527 RepID=UPI000FFBAD56|nr:hypothetical protein [Larkinella soli]